VENERTCPHCGGAVPISRVVCPHCNRTLPSAGTVPPASSPPAYQGPAYASVPTRIPASPPQQQSPVPPTPPVPPPYPSQYAGYHEPPRITPPEPPQDDTMGIVGLIFSIVGLLSCGCLPILCPVGLILSIIAHNKRQTGVTMTGIVLGIIGTFVFILSLIWAVYMAMNPDLQNQILRQFFEQMGVPVPPGLPGQ